MLICWNSLKRSTLNNTCNRKGVLHAKNTSGYGWFARENFAKGKYILLTLNGSSISILTDKYLYPCWVVIFPLTVFFICFCVSASHVVFFPCVYGFFCVYFYLSKCPVRRQFCRNITCVIYIAFSTRYFSWRVKYVRSFICRYPTELVLAAVFVFTFT